MQNQLSHQHPVRAAAAVGVSLLRLSIWQRLAIAAALAAVLWVAVAWALLGTTS
ncbi:MAG TPA: hypothetical protein VH765_06150 [Xanthobacteraceae bacterium]|jgi:hypothetical protein